MAFGGEIVAGLGVAIRALKPIWFVITSVLPQAVTVYDFRLASGSELNAVHHIVDCFVTV